MLQLIHQNVKMGKPQSRKASLLNVLTEFNYQFKNVQTDYNFLKKIKLVCPDICCEKDAKLLVAILPSLIKGRTRKVTTCSSHCVTDFKYIQCILLHRLNLYPWIFGTVTECVCQKIKAQKHIHVQMYAMLRSGYFSGKRACWKSCFKDFQDSRIRVKCLKTKIIFLFINYYKK